MPVPLPGDDLVLLVPPDADEAAFVARGVVSAVTPATGLTQLQDVLLRAFFESMTGHSIEPATAEPIDAAEFAAGMARRNLAFRTRVVQVMLLAELVLRPLPADVADRVGQFAAELGVDDDILVVAQEYAAGSLELASADFARNRLPRLDRPGAPARAAHRRAGRVLGAGRRRSTARRALAQSR